SDHTLTQVHPVGDVSVVEFGPNCELVEDQILEALGAELLAAVRAADPPRVILDLTRTKFFGSGFIEVLLRVWKELQHKPQARMILCGVQIYCREVLEITHLDQLWPIVATRDEALERMAAGA
ncbi:MAG: hypothetical protein B7Z55_18925, partial [Planctomycetales bacterium 12-60-4]